MSVGRVQISKETIILIKVMMDTSNGRFINTDNITQSCTKYHLEQSEREVLSDIYCAEYYTVDKFELLQQLRKRFIRYLKKEGIDYSTLSKSVIVAFNTNATSW